ncbi:MAG: flagellar FlbD family protein [Lachnospiraceae bacterium]|nr:flagellar FlbD family protein [Lachnospiraceae bacterium]
MIELTKLDETKILVNEDHIQTVEETPDTVLTFENGKKLIVKESRMEIRALIFDFRKGVKEE